MRTMTTVQELTFGILGYKEKREWVALALELDIRGYGKTFQEASKELMDLVVTQVAFALFKNQPEMIWKAADPIWFEVYTQARRESLSRRSKKPSPSPYRTAAFSLPPVSSITKFMNQFEPLHASP